VGGGLSSGQRTPSIIWRLGLRNGIPLGNRERLLMIHDHIGYNGNLAHESLGFRCFDQLSCLHYSGAKSTKGPGNARKVIQRNWEAVPRIWPSMPWLCSLGQSACKSHPLFRVFKRFFALFSLLFFSLPLLSQRRPRLEIRAAAHFNHLALGYPLLLAFTLPFIIFGSLTLQCRTTPSTSSPARIGVSVQSLPIYLTLVMKKST